MPTYVYECHKCEREHEVMQRFADAPLTKCPKCGGKVTKKITAGEFILKGGGFYVTDHKSGSNGTPTVATDGKNGKSEAKPAKKPTSRKTKK